MCPQLGSPTNTGISRFTDRETNRVEPRPIPRRFGRGLVERGLEDRGGVQQQGARGELEFKLASRPRATGVPRPLRAFPRREAARLAPNRRPSLGPRPASLPGLPETAPAAVALTGVAPPAGTSESRMSPAPGDMRTPGMNLIAGRFWPRSQRPTVAGRTPSIAATSRCSRPRSDRHAFNRSPSVRGASDGLHFEAMRLFRYSGKKANNPEGESLRGSPETRRRGAGRTPASAEALSYRGDVEPGLGR